MDWEYATEPSDARSRSHGRRPRLSFVFLLHGLQFAANVIHS